MLYSAAMPPAAKPTTTRRVLRLLRWVALLALVVLAVPYVLTPIYAVTRPVSTLMLWRWMTGAKVERSYVPLEALPRSLPLSVIVAEDGRFCSHNGIDWKEMRDAIEEADDISEARGGSTLVQQLAKNLFLWPGRSFVRKALEFPLALWIDLVLSKRRIMELYLNIAEWGPDGQFGADAGARRAFGKSARSLNGRESALMAAVLPNPRRRLAGRPGPGLRRLAGIYEGRARHSSGVADCIK